MSFINYVTQIQIDFGALKLLQAECEISLEEVPATLEAMLAAQTSGRYLVKI